MGVRNTKGTDTCSLYIQRSLAAVLTNESTASVLKSPNMISTTGRRPRSAMPAARPVIPASETGVANTRSGKAEDKPRVTLKAPPYGRECPRQAAPRADRRLRRAAGRWSARRARRSIGTSGGRVSQGLLKGSPHQRVDFNIHLIL